MKLKLEFCEGLCILNEFVINDIKADSYDFGDNRDTDPTAYLRTGEPVTCTNMVFFPLPFRKEISEKYKINEKEYQQIIEQLVFGLSFGKCNKCFY